MEKVKRKLFVGIDLGWKEKKTTGLCVLENETPVLLKEVFGKDVVKTINPYLKDTKVIAVDAPLTRGKGKGKMRLFEKFLSTGVFRREKANPVPPILMPELSNIAEEVAEELKERGFALNINLIEISTHLIRKLCQGNSVFKNSLAKNENQESAFICAEVAVLHSEFQTRWLGYKDGFLFLPEMSFWQNDWKDKFYRAWKEKPSLNYRYLVTNIFHY
ncbi:MAG: DUF429 domain-containing protein [Candidatus Pacebacteria bacterium]|nr:DUF429 domain-containing protein [Candidatus Paceibacterota bacterium]